MVDRGASGRDPPDEREAPAQREHLLAGRRQESSGRSTEALACYQSALDRAESVGDRATISEAARRIAILRHRSGDSADARALCRRSYDAALDAGDDRLAAEALNALGGLDIAGGELDGARRSFVRALALGGHDAALRAKVEQNLGIVANIHGDLSEAFTRYQRSLEAYRRAGDDHGCAIAYHNLGMASADRGLHQEAGAYFSESFRIAEQTGDQYLAALCLVNQGEAEVARQCYEQARHHAEEALARFERLGVPRAKSEAYRVIGMMYRETGRQALAESLLRAAMQTAEAAAAVLAEAEGARELAILYQGMGRNQEALHLLNRAHHLFRRVDARVDRVHAAGKVAELEETYRAVVRAWGESIESSDSGTFGHCERVSELAVAIARELGLDDERETTILLGAYLHDLGKLKVPHEILHKAGPLTAAEREIVEMHPVWGVLLLGAVEFPWDLKPIIRWHHERCDGSGYPDGLRGDEVPLEGQIVGIAEAFDALTSPSPYRAAVPAAAAAELLIAHAAWWRDDVRVAFASVVRHRRAD